MSITRRQAFHSNLDELHVQDLYLWGATCEETEEAYIARFEELPDGIDFSFELELWQEHNPVCMPKDFVAKDGQYIRDTTPISAEQWEAMHGIGQEPMQDERPVMMIGRQIVNGTAGYVGRTAFDSVKVWRLYATPSGEIWGAEWSHGTEWTQSTWGSMQHVQKFIDAAADINDILTEWERY